MSNTIDESESIEDILDMFKSPEKKDAKGKCILIRKIEKLPPNVYEALTIALTNKDITNREILAFINTKTDVQTNINTIQDHRHKEGCFVCLYGTARA